MCRSKFWLWHQKRNSALMEEDIEAILAGKHVAIENKLDFQSQISQEELCRVPITKRNVCYICNCVLFNEEGQVVLVQEAKKSCYGQWYLPAGRMEPRETILDGAKRELKEEAGLECDLTTLLCVEINHIWIRFTFTGKITGGKLKTMDEKDKESLQAKFFSTDNLPQNIRSKRQKRVVTDEDTKRKRATTWKGEKPDTPILRCNDIVKLIQLGKEFHDKESTLRPPDCLPVIHPHKHITHRIVIMDRQTAGDETMHILTSTEGKTVPHIPCLFGSLLKPTNIHSFVAFILKTACSVNSLDRSLTEWHHVCGILGLEHSGTGEEEDGLCITYLVNLNLTSDAQRPATTSESFFWHPVKSKAIQERLKACSLGQIVPLL